MRCPKCRLEHAEDEFYCNQCGTELRSTTTSIVSAQQLLPAVLQHPQLPRSVAAGVGAVALGFGLELLRRGLLARLTRPARSLEPALPALNEIREMVLPRGNKPMKPPKGYEIQETVVYLRRVIRKAH